MVLDPRFKHCDPNWVGLSLQEIINIFTHLEKLAVKEYCDMNNIKKNATPTKEAEEVKEDASVQDDDNTSDDDGFTVLRTIARRNTEVTEYKRELNSACAIVRCQIREY